jgi:hypothetical protein
MQAHTSILSIWKCLKNGTATHIVIITLLYHTGAVIVVIVWELDIQLPMQPVLITTEFVSSNPAQARCTRYNKHYVIKFVSDLGQISGLLQVSSTNKTDRIDITEIFEHHNLNAMSYICQRHYYKILVKMKQHNAYKRNIQ